MNTIAGLVKKSDICLIYILNRRIHCNGLNVLMKCITHLGSTTFSILLSTILFLSPKQEFENIGNQMIITLILTQIIVQIIKRIVNRPRPYITLSNIDPINPPHCKYSFPSGHTCAAFSIAFVLAQHIPIFSLIFLLLATLVALSRIYLGVHYPTDVVIGLIIAYTVVKTLSIL